MAKTNATLRKEMCGVSLSLDQLFRVTGKGFVVGFTAYNFKVTGYAPLLAKLVRRSFPVLYGARTPALINNLRKRGFEVKEVR